MISFIHRQENDTIYSSNSNQLVIHSIIIALVYFQLNEMGLKGCAFLRLGNLSWCNDVVCLINW